MSGKGKGRKATQPKRGWQPPKTLKLEELVYLATLDDSVEPFKVDATRWGAPLPMSREILSTIQRMVEIEGRWRQRATLRSNYFDIANFATWVGKWDSPSVAHLKQPQSISDITPAAWDAYKLSQPANKSSNTRLIRVSFILNASGLLTSEAAERVNARKRQDFDSESTVDHYTTEEFRAIVTAAKRVIREAHARITKNYEEALTGANHTGEPTRASVLFGMLTNTRINSRKHARLIDRLPSPTKRLNPDTKQMETHYPPIEVFEARRMLYPDAGEGLAAAVLLVAMRGLNMSQIETMTLPKRDMDTAGEFSQVATDKPRRGSRRRFSLEVFSNNGDDADGKWLERIEEMTNPLRHHLELTGKPSKLLVLSMDKKGHVSSTTLTGGSGGGRSHVKWLQGLPAVDFKKLKRTFETRHAKESTQNMEAVHLRAYMACDPERVAEYQDLAATAINRAYQHALDTVQLQFVDDQSPEALTAEDTAISSCIDPEHEPRTGLPCADGFLGCLSCTNAIATPRHIPMMRFTLELLTEIRSVLPDHLWTTRFQGPYAQLQVVLESAPTSSESKKVTQAQKNLIRTALGLPGGAS